MKRRIHFWARIACSDVRITMRAGQTIHWSQGRPTDEGWERESKIWTFSGGLLVLSWHRDGADCDGRLTGWGTATCLESEIAAGRSSEQYPHVVYPKWSWGKAEQRDHSAEAMGY